LSAAALALPVAGLWPDVHVLAQQAQDFIEREWQQSAIGNRYDWLFTYDAMTAAI